MRPPRYGRVLALAGFLSCCFAGQAQILGDQRPIIIGQQYLSTPMGQPITIELTDLIVVDFDDEYPGRFTLTLYKGKKYSFTNTTVFPDPGFVGSLKVPVSVNDGEKESKIYELKIDVTEIENIPPVITGQYPLSTEENSSLVIDFGDLKVTDPDNDYPGEFTLRIYSGENYSVSGNTVKPDKGFKGTLYAEVTVNDGEDDSNIFTLEIEVYPANVAPVITGQVELGMEEGTSLTISLSHLVVQDPDSKYPADFTLTVYSGKNYKVSGNTISPNSGFTGTINPDVSVNDGKDESEKFTLEITVRPKNRPPVITGQAPLAINEDESIAITFSDLTVTDPDNSYPQGFTLRILPGIGYTVSQHTIIPAPNFHGTLTANVIVNDGRDDSNAFPLSVTVNPVNDPPELVMLETRPLRFMVGKGPVLISETVEVKDVDNDNLTVAEVGFDDASYRQGIDVLIYDGSQSPAINGVFDSGRGIMFLIGNAPPAEYTKAIRSVRYNYVLSEENTVQDSTKRVYFKSSDGVAESTPVSRSIDLIATIALSIPNWFTPNGDSANDTWRIRSLNSSDDYADALIRVYTIMGTKVYEAIGLDTEWDGRYKGELLPTDTYYFTIDLNLTYTRATYKGIVTILR